MFLIVIASKFGLWTFIENVKLKPEREMLPIELILMLSICGGWKLDKYVVTPAATMTIATIMTATVFFLRIIKE